MICSDCGHSLQQDKTKIMKISTFSMGICSVCGKIKAVTEDRDFGYPTYKKTKLKKKITIDDSDVYSLMYIRDMLSRCSTGELNLDREIITIQNILYQYDK